MSTADDNTAGGSEEITSNKEVCTCEQNNIDNLTEGFDGVAILDDKCICANCGKEGNSDNMNTCNKCKSVKYCNAACKKKHRSKHKKACEKRMAELHEEHLFKEVEPEDCPICMLPLPHEGNTVTFKTCCGKKICNGCIYAMMISEGRKGAHLCPLCRTPPPSGGEEKMKRLNKLLDCGNGNAFNHLAGYYSRGINGMPQDYQKANELLLKAGELGCAEGYYNLGNSYDNGRGVEIDEKKAKHYYELAAMMGCVSARNNLGCNEYQAGNFDRAMKHFILAAGAGHKRSLEVIKQGFEEGDFTNDVYEEAESVYHERKKEMSSDERVRAEALGIFR